MNRALALIGAVMILTGCVSVAPGQDPVVVRSEQIQSLTFEAMDAFLLWEWTNRASLPYEIQEFANKLRSDGQRALRQAYSLTKAYKDNRTEENKVAVETIIATLTSLKAQIAVYMLDEA